MAFRRRRPSLARDALRGALAGLAASWVMEQAQLRVIQRLGSARTRDREEAAQQGLEPATVQVANAAARLIGRAPLGGTPRKVGAETVHYGTGAAFGALFGAVAPRIAFPLLAAGTLYGLLVWMANDELLVPALGFSRAPTAYPASVHAKAAASHAVYGVATGAGFSLLGKIMH
jgi:hypothetical protein